MESWHREIVELHEFFEAYFLGSIPADDIGRFEDVLADDFTIIGAHGEINDRAATIEMVRAGHAHTRSLEITITDASLLRETPELVVARYIENHQLTDRTNHRWSTVVFVRDPEGPNGLRWVTVQETWVGALDPADGSGA